MASVLDGKRLISESILSDIADAIREKYGSSATIKPVDMAELIRSLGGETAKQWYVWYMSNIAPIDGMYNSHSYSNVYIVGDELVVLYRSAPHHYSGSELVTMRCSRTNLTTWESVSEDVLTDVNYFGSVYCDGVYYIFDQSKYRYTTTDFKTFEKTAYTTPATEPYYIVVGDNNRFISAHSNSQSKGTMMYSDDLGITWVRATGDDIYNATLTTHGACVRVGDTIVAYCQAGKNDTATDNTTTLNVLTSTDNGLTWSGAEAVDEDLKYPGPSFTSGMFAQIGDEWFLCLSSRLRYTDDDGNLHIGNVRLFKGTAEEVISGNMHLCAMVDDFDCGTKTVQGANSVIMTDTGNIGMTTDGESLYIVYAKPLMASSVICSNNMLALAVVNASSTDISRPDSYHNGNWETERDAFVAAQDTKHDLYIYGDGGSVLTNANGIEIATNESYWPVSYKSGLSVGNVAPLGDIVIPFNEYFEMRMVKTIANRYVNAEYQQHYYGINVGGKKHALSGSVNEYNFNRTNSTSGAASLATTNGTLIDFALRYENGVVTVTLNGDTIADVQSYVVVDTELNPEGNTALLSFAWAAAAVTASAGIGNALVALTIDTDGDISELLGVPTVDPEIQVYTINNTLTNCANSNAAVQINEGTAYEAQITADKGYQLDSVVITMGGTDVTADVYADGIITIESVTGDIIITATATEIPIPDPVTDGLILSFDVRDVAEAEDSTLTWPAAVGDMSLTPTSYDAESNLAVPGASVILGTNAALGIDTSVGLSIEGVFNQTSTGDIIRFSPGCKAYSVEYSVGGGGGINIAGTGYSELTNHFWMGKLLHTVLSLDVQNGIAEIYINGELKVSITEELTFTESNSWGLPIKTYPLGNFRVYNRPLTAAEVSNNYQHECGTYAFTELS